MNTQNIITRQLDAIESGFGWISHVPQSERLEFKKRLINLRREFRRIQYAVSEPCSTAAFGESQMGKSYLVSAMLSTPSSPFSVTDGNQEYDFINDINPSRPNSTIEATGVITRFSAQSKDCIPEGWLKVKLLSVTDIVLILCEAFYNQIDYVQEEILPTTEINNYLDTIIVNKTSKGNGLLIEDDVLDIKEYLDDRRSVLHKKCNSILDSEYFNFLVANVNYLSDSQLSEIIQLLWNRNIPITKLWSDMTSTYRTLLYASTVYARFDAVLKRKGTLLDVARLDEMYGPPEDCGSEYEEYTEVKLLPNDQKTISIKKSFFSSLIAELCFILPAELTDSHPFLQHLDILDFPGARRPEQIRQEKLNEGKNLSTVLRRGKVTYLFNKYSAAKRISSLLFCHNNSMSGESSMGGLLDKWVMGNVGDNMSQREDFVKRAEVSPLFIIGTWFNKDLEYQDETPGDSDSLNARWNRRFNTVLEKEVLKSLDDQQHWFNAWTTSQKPFQNIYMLRDFKYSRTIYQGYDPRQKKAEEGEPIRPTSYPKFFSDLKSSFLKNEFVHRHFAFPNEAWEAAAACAQDGSQLIISNLNILAPNARAARAEKFEADLKNASQKLYSLFEQYYHPESSEEQLKLARRQAGDACLKIDLMQGRDSYAFGRLMDTMMVSESEIYELVHSQLLGEEQELPMSSEEAQIFMSAGLDTSASRDENVKTLCRYLGVDSEEECQRALVGIDIEKLLAQRQMMADNAATLVETVENMWHDKVLMTRTVQMFENQLPPISTMMASMWSLYQSLGIRTQLIEKVREYLNNIEKNTVIGIVADYLAVQFNRFVGSFGYAFLSPKDRERIVSKNASLHFDLDFSLFDEDTANRGISLLADLYQQRAMLAGGQFRKNDRKFLARFPQYRRVWRWEQQLRIAYIIGSELPDYDVEANAQLKTILDGLISCA